MSIHLIGCIMLFGSIGGILLFFWLLIHNQDMNWEIYGVCKCGYKRIAPFGKLFHIHQEVCPECGESKDGWELKTMRLHKRKGEAK